MHGGLYEERSLHPLRVACMNETEYLLMVFAEECAEVAQRASKAARFGLSEVQPGQFDDNRRRIEHELGDLMGVADMLGFKVRDDDKASKIIKVKYFMEYSRKQGLLEESPECQLCKSGVPRGGVAANGHIISWDPGTAGFIPCTAADRKKYEDLEKRLAAAIDSPKEGS